MNELIERAVREAASPTWQACLRRLVPGLEPDPRALALHPDDQMLRHSLAHHGHVDVALSQYYAIAVQQVSMLRQILAAAAPPAPTLLDFACGYGRLLRLSEPLVPRARTVASDIQPEAVRFVREAFGVRALLSSFDPARFDPGQRFDAIWVASLFSHLPDGLFRGWLARLAGLLTPAGVLCFSVRDAALLPAAARRADAALQYDEASENAALPGELYGTAYANEAYVAQVLAEVAPQRPWHRLPRALANEQDLYLLAGAPGRDLGALATLRRGPWGWLDVRRCDADGNLDLQGWAASLDDGAVADVRVRVGGAEFPVERGIERPDVAAAYEDPRMAQSGWRVEVSGARVDAATRVDIEAVDRRGACQVLYAGSLG